MESVCIYGGGNIAHSLAAAVSAKQPVTVVTRHPSLWAKKLSFVQNGKRNNCGFEILATSDAKVASESSVIFIALPQFAIEEALTALLPNLGRGAEVAFVPAPAKTAEYARRIEGAGCRVAGFQRVPFISRTVEYGKSVSISTPRSVNKLVVSDEELRSDWRRRCKEWFGNETEFLSSFMSFAF